MKRRCMRLAIAGLALGLVGGMAQPLVAQNRRDERVRRDREQLAQDDTWNYEDYESARAQAAREQRPLMVVLRCVP